VKIQRVRDHQVFAAARDAGVLVRIKRIAAHQPKQYYLRPAGPRFRSANNHLCVHGYACFLDALFAREPGARVETSIAVYEGREDFLLHTERDAKRGAEMFPEACKCES
jgi:hypothetical protein